MNQYFCLYLFVFYHFCLCECRIFFQDSVSFPSGPITLDKLGELSCNDIKTKQEYEKNLKSFSLGTLYPGSLKLEFERDYLQLKWEQFFKDQPLLFAGSKKIILTPELNRIQTESILQKANEEIIKHLNLDPNNYRIEFVNFPKEILLSPEQEIIFDTSSCENGALRIKITAKERSLQQFFVRFLLFQKTLVMIAKENLERDTPLSPLILQIHEDWVDKKSSVLVIEDLSSLGDWETSRLIPKGSPLTLQNTRQKKLVNSRDLLKGIYNSGNIYIEIQVQALQAGRKNEVIQVQAPATRKKYSAKVLDSQRVEIQ